MRMNKKGASVILMIFEVIVVILLISIGGSIVQGYSSSDSVFRQYTASDLQMMINTIVALQGDTYIEYPGNLSNYVILLNQDGIELFKEGEDQFTRTKKSFYLPVGFSASGVVDGISKVCLEKVGKDIFLDECNGI
jgi:hypothetical protein